MKFLYELDKELKRCVIAGNNSSYQDPQLLKLIPILQKAGQKVPILKKLAEQVEGVVNDEHGNAINLIQATTLAESLVCATAKSKTPTEEKEIEYFNCLNDNYTQISYKTFREHISFLDGNMNLPRPNMLERVNELNKIGFFNDPRVIFLLIKHIEKAGPTLLSVYEKEVIINYGKNVVPLLKSTVVTSGDEKEISKAKLIRGNQVRFRLIAKMGRDEQENIDFIRDCIESDDDLLCVSAVHGVYHLDTSIQREIFEMVQSHKNKKVSQAAKKFLGGN